MIVKPREFPYVDMCPYCEGTGVHWYNPDWPMSDCGQREAESCLNCNERGWLIPKEWIAPNGTSARLKAGGGSSDPKATHLTS